MSLKYKILWFLVAILDLLMAVKSSKPNVVLLLADDLGYGDLDVYGHPTSQTPHLHELASNGLLFTQFYSASSICSPSRAALMTGRFQSRSGVWPGLFEPNSIGGLPHNETTIADLLKPAGYQTAIVGKWHLGVGKDNMFLPTTQGFDEYYGVPYSHDMCPCNVCFYPNDKCLNVCDPAYTSCPLFDGTKIIEQPVNLTTLHERYLNRSLSFISENAANGTPFFLYYAFQHTHHPQYAGKAFRNSTIRRAFGDSLAELDDAVGQVIAQLGKSGVANNTFVFFTSDNGPSLQWENNAGSAGLLKCGKGTTYEGGQREPTIAYWPGKIGAGNRTTELGATIDILPTIAAIIGVPLPNDTLDGVDLGPVLFKNEKSPRESYFFYPSNPTAVIGLYAVRHRQYKAHYYTQGNFNSGINNHDRDCSPISAPLKMHDPPLLFDLHQDPSEQFNINGNPGASSILAEIDAIKKKFEATMEWGPSQISKLPNPDVEPCCTPLCDPFPLCCNCEGSTSYSKYYFLKNQRG